MNMFRGTMDLHQLNTEGSSYLQHGSSNGEGEGEGHTSVLSQHLSPSDLGSTTVLMPYLSSAPNSLN
eukprot:4526998-Amphidinium_carterae.2